MLLNKRSLYNIEILEKGRKSRISYMKVWFLALWLIFPNKQNHTKMRLYFSLYTKHVATQNVKPLTCDGPIKEGGVVTVKDSKR